MLTPEELAMIPDGMVEIFQKLDEFVIKDFARRVAKTGMITETATWQAIRMQELGVSLKAIEEEVARTLNVSYSYIDSLFSQASKHSMEVDNKTFEAAGLTTEKIQNSPMLSNYIKAAIRQTKGEMKNISQSLGFAQTVNGKVVYKDIAKYYQDALDLAQWQVSSGVLDYNTAVKNAVRTMSQSGLRYVNYESGWANRADVAVRRATLTGVNQMAGKLNDFYCEELELDLVEVTAHAGARPSHSAWQGKVFSRSGRSKKYPPFSETGIGTGAGLLGWNCRHNYYGYVEGQPRMYTQEQLDNIDPPPFKYKGKTYTYYEATQYQRQIENDIRITKREILGFDAAGQKESFTAASIKLQQDKQLYKDFSKTAGLRTRLERTGVLDYNKSISQKAVWSAKKEVEKYSKYHYNKDGTIVVTDDWTNKLKPSIPSKYKANAVIDTRQTYKNGFVQFNRSYYDQNGTLCEQIHASHHNRPDQHNFDGEYAHVHVVKFDKDGKRINVEPSKLNDNEKIRETELLRRQNEANS